MHDGGTLGIFRRAKPDTGRAGLHDHNCPEKRKIAVTRRAPASEKVERFRVPALGAGSTLAESKIVTFEGDDLELRSKGRVLTSQAGTVEIAPDRGNFSLGR